MEIHVNKVADDITITVSGSLNTNTAPELEGVMESTFSESPSAKTLTFDFADLEYISSAGLRILMVAYKRGQENSTRINVVNPSDEVHEVLEVTGFAELFEN